jgi:hypothetical protein
VKLGTARGWIRPDGEPVGDGNPYDQNVRAAIRLDETGTDVGVVGLWQPSYIAGANCTDWTVTTVNGRQITTVRGNNYWSGGGDVSCTTASHVLCAENDRVQQVAPVPDVGRIAFVSSTTWSDGAGAAAADAVCAGDASGASLPGSYLALLATNGTSPLSRFDLTGAPWVRVDGTRLLPTASAWQTASLLDAAPGMGPTGQLYLYVMLDVGSTGVATAGSAFTTCNGWTGTGSTSCPMYSWDTSISVQCSTACGQSRQLMCLQE